MIELSRPEADEYDPYYTGYVEQIREANVIDVLRRQQLGSEAILTKVTDEAASFRYAPDKWSVKEVVGHVSDTERVFTYRALCIARGDTQSLPGMDQDIYVAGANFETRSMDSMVQEFSAVRSATIALFESLDQESWVRRGVANDVAVSVRALAFIIAGHEFHHMAILRDRYGVGS